VTDDLIEELREFADQLAPPDIEYADGEARESWETSVSIGEQLRELLDRHNQPVAVEQEALTEVALLHTPVIRHSSGVVCRCHWVGIDDGAWSEHIAAEQAEALRGRTRWLPAWAARVGDRIHWDGEGKPVEGEVIDLYPSAVSVHVDLKCGQDVCLVSIPRDAILRRL
jgi:hypothetical protein